MRLSEGPHKRLPFTNQKVGSCQAPDLQCPGLGLPLHNCDKWISPVWKPPALVFCQAAGVAWSVDPRPTEMVPLPLPLALISRSSWARNWGRERRA